MMYGTTTALTSGIPSLYVAASVENGDEDDTSDTPNQIPPNLNTTPTKMGQVMIKIQMTTMMVYLTKTMMMMITIMFLIQRTMMMITITYLMIEIQTMIMTGYQMKMRLFHSYSNTDPNAIS